MNVYRFPIVALKISTLPEQPQVGGVTGGAHPYRIFEYCAVAVDPSPAQTLLVDVGRQPVE